MGAYTDVNGALRDMAVEGRMEPLQDEDDLTSTAELEIKPHKSPPLLTDETELFWKAILPKIGEGRMDMVTVPIVGLEGTGKTWTAMSAIEGIVTHFGRDNVNVVAGYDIRDLVGEMDEKLIQCILVDDALRKGFSRGGTPKHLREGIANKTEARHKSEDRKMELMAKSLGMLKPEEEWAEDIRQVTAKLKERLDDKEYAKLQTGAVIIFYTAQVFLGLEKTYRMGLIIIKGPIDEDKDGIMKTLAAKYEGDSNFGYKRATEAWKFLMRIQKRVLFEWDHSAKEECIVALPGPGASILKIPAPSKEFRDWMATRWVDDLIDESAEDRATRQYKAQDHIAHLFLTQYPNGPRMPGAAKLLSDMIWTKSLAIGGADKDPLLKGGDFLELVEPKSLQAIMARAYALYEDKKATTPVPRGTGTTDDDIIEEAVQEIVGSGIEPTRNGAGKLIREFLRTHYRDKPEAFRERLYKLTKRIEDAAFSKGLARLQEEAKNRVAQTETEPQRYVQTGEGFKFDVRKFVLDMPRRLAAQEAQRDGISHRDAIIKWRRQAKAYELHMLEGREQNRIDPVKDLEVIIETEEGTQIIAGPKVSIRQVSNYITAAKGAVGMAMGEAYEVFVEERIKSGWRAKWMSGRPKVTKVERGGGNSDSPDITVVYENGDQDHVSCKCYANEEYVTIYVKPADGSKGDVHPELSAMIKWSARDPAHKHRLVVLFCDPLTDGMEVYRVFEDKNTIPPRVAIDKKEAGGDSYVGWFRPTGQKHP